jgi:hypothetical protein
VVGVPASGRRRLGSPRVAEAATGAGAPRVFRSPRPAVAGVVAPDLLPTHRRLRVPGGGRPGASAEGGRRRGRGRTFLGRGRLARGPGGVAGTENAAAGGGRQEATAGGLPAPRPSPRAADLT